MKKTRSRMIWLLVALFFSALLAACGGKEFAYQDSNDLKPGPGLFSGADGAFTIFSGALGEEDSENAPAP